MAQAGIEILERASSESRIRPRLRSWLIIDLSPKISGTVRSGCELVVQLPALDREVSRVIDVGTLGRSDSVLAEELVIFDLSPVTKIPDSGDRSIIGKLA